METKIIIPLKIFVMVIVVLFTVTGLVGAQQLMHNSPQAGAPLVVSYSGEVSVNGIPHNKNGYFKFAVVNAAGDVSYWSNDGSSANGAEPTMGVVLPVSKGLFTVLLGDTTLAGMTQPLSAGVFSGTERYLRVWFSSEDVTYELLEPDQRIAAVPYALQAQQAADADTVDGHHASEFGLLPAGTMVLGNTANDSALIAAGFSYTGQWFDNWLIRADMLTNHEEHGVATVNGKIHVFGGISTSAHEAYDPNSDSWNTRAPMLAGRARMAVAVVDDVIYAIGGNESTIVEAYYPITDTWVTKASVPTGRSGAAAAVVDGVIYVIGGGTVGGNSMAANEAYNPAIDSWTTKAPMPIGKTSLAAAAVDGVIYAIGGWSEDGVYTANQAYDPVADQWTTKANLPQEITVGNAVVVDGLAHVLGMQCTGLERLAHLVYNPTTNSWSSYSPPQYHPQYYGFALAAVGRSIHIFGGGYNIGHEIYVLPLYIYRKD